MVVATIVRGPSTVERPPLLFVHGALHGAWCWDEHFLKFFVQQGYRAVALDLRGHGATPSDKSVTAVSIKEYVADLASVAEGLDQVPILIGHSLGGFVVQRYLETHDSAGAVLVGSLPPAGAMRLTLRAARHSPLAAVRVFATLKLLPLFGARDAAKYWFFSEETSEQDLDRYVARLQEESFRAVIDTVARPVRTRLVDNRRLLVLGGELDRTASPADVRRTAQRYGVQPVILPGLPHDMMLDPNWASAARHILDWIEATAPTST